MEFQIEGPKKTDLKFTIVCSGIRKIVRLFCCKSSIFIMDMGYSSEEQTPFVTTSRKRPRPISADNLSKTPKFSQSPEPRPLCFQYRFYNFSRLAIEVRLIPAVISFTMSLLTMTVFIHVELKSSLKTTVLVLAKLASLC